MLSGNHVCAFKLRPLQVRFLEWAPMLDRRAPTTNVFCTGAPASRDARSRVCALYVLVAPVSHRDANRSAVRFVVRFLRSPLSMIQSGCALRSSHGYTRVGFVKFTS